ncbi:hypothetical protein D3C72_1503580 [compost metagenome]
MQQWLVGAIAQPHEAAGALLQEVGKVLAAGNAGGLRHHLVGAHQFLGHLARELGLALTIDQHRVAAHIVDFGRRAIALGMRGGELADAVFQRGAHVRAERAHAELHARAVRDHIGRVAGVQRADGHHRGFVRVDIARYHRLQRHHQAAGHQDRIDRLVRTRRVAALAADGDGDRVARRHERARAEQEVALLHARMVVQAEDRVTREAFEQAVGQHALGAAARADLLGRLEDHVHGAVEGARARQLLGRAQQDRGVAVVAAGMHAAGVGAGVR